MLSKHHPLKIFGIFLFFLSAIIFSPAAYGQDDGDLPGQQTRAVPDLDVIIIVDESETMWSTTDPDNIRVNTVDFFIDILTAEQSGNGHRLAIIPFGSQPQVIPYTLLDGPTAAQRLKKDYAALHQSIEPTKDVQYTDINKALQETLALLSHERDPVRKPAVIFISDGQPTSPEVSERQGRAVVESYLEETKELLNQLNQYEYTNPTCSDGRGVPFFTIGMGIQELEQASTPEFIALYREFWQGIASQDGGYYREANRLQEMQGITTYIFSELLCTPATPPITFRESQTLEYQVYNSYFQIIFTISGKDNPDLVAQIYRPNEDGSPGGKLLKRDEPGVSWQSGPDYEVWRVSYGDPWPGTWQVALKGEGQAEFSYVIFPNIGINITEPNSGFQPVDKPFTLRAAITDEEGEVIPIPVNDFQVEIEGPDTRRVVSLEQVGDEYMAQLDPFEKTGEYSLIFSTIMPDGSPIFEHKWVTLTAAPWAEVTSPSPATTYDADESIPLEAKVHLIGAVPLDGVKMIARLQQGDEAAQTIELSQGEVVNQNDEERVVTYSGEFQPVDATGDYEIQTQLTAILPGGRVFDSDSAPVALSVNLPPTPTLVPTDIPVVPTRTRIPVAAVAAPATSLPSPTVAPAPASEQSGLLGDSYWPCLALLLLLLLIPLVIFLWRKQQQEEIPGKIKLLATLMKSRQESGQPPYLLLLGSGDSIMIGSKSMRQVVEAIVEELDVEKFHRTLDGFSAVERYSMLKKNFDNARVSNGYSRLAKLIENGYFSLVFTTNLDPFVEQSLASRNGRAAGHEILICGQQRIAETLEMIQNEEPPVKIVKLHGDVTARSFAFTPSEISEYGNSSERILREYLSRDVIIIGPGDRDYDINRAIESKGGSIWYINSLPPMNDGPIFRAMRARRSDENIIDGDFGEFDRFFEALYKALLRL